MSFVPLYSMEEVNSKDKAAWHGIEIPCAEQAHSEGGRARQSTSLAGI
jgi:hypothetical protein